MGKRQTRLFPHQFLEKSGFLIGKEANVTLLTQATFHGVLLEITRERLNLRDMRLKKHTFSIADVAEIILDEPTDW